MDNLRVNDMFYKKWETIIDPVAFVVAGFIGFKKLRSIEWLHMPITQQGMVVSSTINGFALYLSHQIGKGNKSKSPYYQAALTLMGFAVGTIAAPYITSKILKTPPILITTQIAIRMTAFNIVTKVVVYAAFVIGEWYYGSWNFPPFQKFEEMTPHTIRIFYNYFKDQPEMWHKLSFKKQLGFNYLLLQQKLPALKIAFIDLEAHLTKTELETFRKLFENEEMTSKQATLLYNFHVSPQTGVYSDKQLPMIDPRNVNVEELSDEQLKWHYEWILAHPSIILPECQIQAFVPHFYRLNLVPPSELFVAELPLPNCKDLLSIAKVCYLEHFYKANQHKWDALQLDQQIFLRELFGKHRLKSYPLREPTIDQMESLKREYVEEYKNWFKKESTQWDLKPRNYQEAFNNILEGLGFEPLALTKHPWLTMKKVSAIGGIVLAIVGLIVIPKAIVLMNRFTIIADSCKEGNDVGTCAEVECPTLPIFPIERLTSKHDSEIRRENTVDNLVNRQSVDIMTCENNLMSKNGVIPILHHTHPEITFPLSDVENEAECIFKAPTACTGTDFIFNIKNIPSPGTPVVNAVYSNMGSPFSESLLEQDQFARTPIPNFQNPHELELEGDQISSNPLWQWFPIGLFGLAFTLLCQFRNCKKEKVKELKQLLEIHPPDSSSARKELLRRQKDKQRDSEKVLEHKLQEQREQFKKASQQNESSDKRSEAYFIKTLHTPLHDTELVQDEGMRNLEIEDEKVTHLQEKVQILEAILKEAHEKLPYLPPSLAEEAEKLDGSHFPGKYINGEIELLLQEREELKEQLTKLSAQLPFATLGSEEQFQERGCQLLLMVQHLNELKQQIQADEFEIERLRKKVSFLTSQHLQNKQKLVESEQNYSMFSSTLKESQRRNTRLKENNKVLKATIKNLKREFSETSKKIELENKEEASKRKKEIRTLKQALVRREREQKLLKEQELRMELSYEEFEQALAREYRLRQVALSSFEDSEEKNAQLREQLMQKVKELENLLQNLGLMRTLLESKNNNSNSLESNAYEIKKS